MNPVEIWITLSYTVNHHRKGRVIFMEKVIKQRFQRIQVILFIAAAILLFFGGCGNESDDTGKVAGLGSESVYGEEEQGESTRAEESEETSGQEEQEQNGDFAGEGFSLPISRETATVDYAGYDFLKSCVSVGGDGIYLTGFHGSYQGTQPTMDTYFFGKIALGQDSIQEFDMEISEDMFAVQGCVDETGRWHVLLTERIDNAMTWEKSEIWIINRLGEKEATIDMTEAVKQKMLPFWMAVDGQGNYYLANQGGLLMTDSSGEPQYSYKADNFSGLGIGRSGQVYVVIDSSDEEAYLGKLDPDTGVVEECAVFGKKLDSSFSVLQGGVNTELLLANKGNGLWKYDGEKLELSVSTGEILGNGQDISAMGFLADGRACIMGYANGSYRFYYVPLEE